MIQTAIGRAVLREDLHQLVAVEALAQKRQRGDLNEPAPKFGSDLVE